MIVRDETIKILLERSPGLFDDLEVTLHEKQLIESVVGSIVDFCISSLSRSAGREVTEEEIAAAIEKILPELKALLLVFIEGLKVSCDIAWSKSC